MVLGEGCQMILPGFDLIPVRDMTRAQLGYMGEKTAAAALRSAGYRVAPGKPLGGDLHVIDSETGEVLYIEIKTARRGCDGKWRATLIKAGKTDHRICDLVVLLTIVEGRQIVPFVIPVGVLDKPHIVITSDPRTYHGRLATYRQLEGLRLP